MFDIDETLGLITVKRELDKNQRSNYQLIIMATDHGTPPQSSTVTVSISVTVSNNAPPKFTGSNYKAEIHEDIKIGANVAILEAKSQSSVYYEILSGNNGDKFAINPNSGVIYVKNTVDYEQKKSYDVTVSASNIVGYSSFATIKIHIIDVNDNHPEFSQSVFEGSLSEATPVGSVVLTSEGKPLVIHASDKDENDNSRLNFEMIGDEAKKFFTIDKGTGAIRTTNVLDREIIDKVEFTVQVSDHGNPSLSAANPANVLIHIEDINDNAPIFTPSAISKVLLLPTAKGVEVAKLMVTDPDTKSSEGIKFRIIPDTNGFGHFHIDQSTGTLTVAEEKNLKSSYSLSIEASDGKFQSISMVNVTVKDSKSSEFVFSSSQYKVVLQEGKEISDNLMVIQIMNFESDPIVFTLLNEKDKFSIGGTSGVLQTKIKTFDREERDLYNLVIRVEDLGNPPRITQVIVKVIIEDQNDNSPVFLNQPYDTVVAITAEVGAPVRQVSVLIFFSLI